MLAVLKVRLRKPAIYKWKILGGGKFEYYKSMGITKKRGEGGGESVAGIKFLKFGGGKQKGGDEKHNF